jgi:type IV fimbrial biogenesis protein FimT
MSRIQPFGGFTLVELMVTVAVIAVVLAVSVPAFARLQGNFQLRSSAHRLVAAINLARTEALQRRQSVSLCPSTMGGDCSGDYSHGWVLFNDTDRDLKFAPGIEEVILRGQGLPAGYTVTDRTGSNRVTETITYSPDGSARRNQTLLLCAPPAKGIEPYAIVLNRVGRVRVARGEGLCPGAQR